MHTYLPETQKKELRKEYIVRLLIVICSTLLVITICTIIFMLPAYFVSYAGRTESLKKTEAFSEKGVATETKEVEAQVKAIIDVTNRFADGLGKMNALQAISLAHTALVPGVSIQGIEFTYTASTTVDLRVSGIAKTRETLIAYKKKVETNPMVAKADLPVSDLAKSKDISFVLKILSK